MKKIIPLVIAIGITAPVANALQSKAAPKEEEEKPTTEEVVEIPVNGSRSDIVIKVEGEVTFSISRSPSISKSQPTLSNNEVTLNEGVFGLRANSTTQEMLDVLGIPTSTYKVNDSVCIYSYGRSLWVVTERDVVKKITTENLWVSPTLTNYIAFDDRFNSKWLLEDKVRYSDEKSVLEHFEKRKLIEGDKYRIMSEEGINLDIVLALKIEDGEKRWKVSGFEYGLTDTTYVNPLKTSDNNTESFTDVIAYIENKYANDEAILLSKVTELGQQPVFEAYADNGDIIQVFDNHLMLRFGFGELNQLSVHEGLFNQLPQGTNWKFGKHYAGQPSDEIMALYGDEVMGYDDYWQVFLEDTKYGLYFDENEKGLMTLVELEMAFF